MARETTNKMDSDEITVKELIIIVQTWFLYIWSNWRLIVVAGLIGGVIGFCYALWKPPLYSATTTFVLDAGDGKGGLSQYAGVASMIGVDLGGRSNGLFQGDNIIELYKSRSMIVGTLLSKTYPDSTEFLVDRYIQFKKLRSAWAHSPELESLDFHLPVTALEGSQMRLRDSILTIFSDDIRENMLTVEKPDKNLSIINVNVSSPDETFSKVFNENLVQRVNEFYIQTKIKKSSQNIAILEAKVDSVRQVMEGAIYSSVRVTDETPNINPTRQIHRVAPAQQAQFSAEANKAMLSQLIQNLELARMNLAQEQPLIQLIDQPVYPLKVDKLGKVKGIVVGGFIFGFLTLVVLIVRKWYHDAMVSG